MVLVALLLSHAALFAVSFGVGPDLAEAMSAGGHDGWWGAYTLGVLGVTAILAAGALWRLRRLASLTSDLAPTESGPDAGGYAHELAQVWRSLFAAATVLLVVQENLEHLAAGGHLVGLEPIATPAALVVIGFTALVVASIGALVRWRIRQLEARLVAARRRAWPRVALDPLPDRWWLVGAALRHSRLLARDDPSRAPPLAVLGD
jgi:hypothetical protein